MASNCSTSTIEHCPKDSKVDVLSGYAGVIPLAIDIAQRYDAPNLIDLVSRLADQLVSQAVKEEQGCSWKTPASGHRNSIGFSHGASGIIWALCEMHRVTSESSYLATAKSGFAYEQSQFSEVMGNWPDYRDLGGDPKQLRFPIAWCHGAPGILLSRIRTRALLSDAANFDHQTQAALQTTLADAAVPVNPGGRHHSLCHGVMGNTEAVIEAALSLNMPDFANEAHKIARIGCQREAEGHHWLCGVSQIAQNEMPTLMLGSAGIGHFYLRLHAFDDVPSVLAIGPNSSQLS